MRWGCDPESYLAGSGAQYTAGLSQNVWLKLYYQDMLIKICKFYQLLSLMPSKHWLAIASLETGQNSASDFSGSNSYFPWHMKGIYLLILDFGNY